MTVRVPIDSHPLHPPEPCFGCGPEHPVGLRLRFARDGDEVVTELVPPARLQGPPGVMHGGLVTTLADELAAWTVIGLRDRLGFTSSIEARLLRPIRIAVPVEGRGRIVRESDRALTVEVRLRQSEVECFRAEVTFALPDRSGVERMWGPASSG